MHELILAGGGSGQAAYLLPAVKEQLEQADFVLASERFLSFLQVRQGIPMTHLYDRLEQLPQLLEQGSVAVVVSGDPLLYSLCKTIQKRMPDIKMRILPGVGSLQLLGAAFGITMEQAAILSIHGRDCSFGKIAYAAAIHEAVFFFCSKEQGPREIAQALLQYHVAHTEICVGASLTYPEERCYSGTPEEILLQENPQLCVAAVRNAHPTAVTCPPLLPDEAFLRNRSPMTKEEVRAVILGKLRLFPDAVVWDIGAGTGSISVECARMCPFGTVYAVEQKADALEILQQNRDYFQLEQLQIVSGRAEQVLDTLPMPDCIFIGGSGRELSAILEKILVLPKKIRLVLSAVTLETQAEAYPLLQTLPAFQVVQLNVGYGKRVGTYRTLEWNHPITVYSCVTKE